MKQSSCVVWCAHPALPRVCIQFVRVSPTRKKVFARPLIRERPGGKLVITSALRAAHFQSGSRRDQASMGIIDRLNADLIHINRGTQKTEPSLAKSWTISKDGTQFTLSSCARASGFLTVLPFDADDVVFSYTAYLDEKVPSLHRDLLLVDDKPVKVEKIDAYTVRFIFPGAVCACGTRFRQSGHSPASSY